MARRGKRQSSAPRRRKLPNWPLLGLSATGMALTGYLSATAWFGSEPLYCGAGSSCDVVQTSHWATLLGLPIALWGFFTHAALAYVAGRVKKADLHWSYAWIVALVGLGVSLYLIGVALFVLEAACFYCLASFALVAAIVGVLVWQRPGGLPGFRWPAWLAQTGALATAIVVVLHLHYSGVFHPAAGPEDP
ncbi:MAG: vitamin K epoxide reductase family protein, partial [Planctomycetota bacterium]